jgi:hypothetical protein
MATASSSLNPNAPLFIPAAYRKVEHFSPEWWELVHTTAWFRQHQLHEEQHDAALAALPDDLFYDDAPEPVKPAPAQHVVGLVHHPR